MQEKREVRLLPRGAVPPDVECDTEFKCPNAGCDGVFKNNKRLTYHLNYECGKTQFFKCPFCPLVSDRRSNVYSHIKCMHKEQEAHVIDPEEDDKVFKCANSGCGSAYKNKFHLAQHLKHECGKRPSIMCPFCPFTSFWKGNVRAHVRNQHRSQNVFVINLDPEDSSPDVQKEFKCSNPGCKSEYKNKHHLIHHLKYKCGKPASFKCPFCPYTVIQQCRLRKHIKIMHSKVKIKELENYGEIACPNPGCDRVYKNKYFLNRHLKNKCGKTISYKCPYCSYAAFRSNHVYSHVTSKHESQEVKVIKMEENWDKMRNMCYIEFSVNS